MPNEFSWLAQYETLQPPALTVRAQVLSPNDNGQLIWDVFFPRADVKSIRLSDLAPINSRPAADRREWNARGAFIPTLTPAQRTMSIVPIEAYDKVDEEEQQYLMEGAFGNQQVIRDQIRVSLPDRADRLAMAVYRRLELDAMQAWTSGAITQRDPEDPNKTYTAGFGFDSARYAPQGTAWNDAGINAFDAFLAWYLNAIEMCGPGEGVMLRLATIQEIVKDAPTVMGGARPTRADVANRLQQEIGSAFTFFENEKTIDVPQIVSGKRTLVRTKEWPAHKVAFVPQGKVVGTAAFAPVKRAWEMSQQVPSAGIDVRGVTVYHEASNGGRELTIEAQANPMPVPNEQFVAVTDAGV